MNSCRICHVEARLESLNVREMMFGTRESFTYQLCSACGSLQISDIPNDLSCHYPEGYYAHEIPTMASTDQATSRDAP